MMSLRLHKFVKVLALKIDLNLGHLISYISAVPGPPLSFLIIGKRSNQSILKEISSGISLEGMMLKLKLQYLGHLMAKSLLTGKDSDSGRDWGQEEKGTTEDEMDVSLGELRELVMVREAWRTVIHGVTKSLT